ncbi:hypothetical protein, partial [Vibrio maritimus]|uniref:hypothetical protein n=1 Tax=Vibrio maritimus TaxID=990268 RepID=UPI003736124F
EWPKGADCKSAGTAFDGSNPSPPTIQKKNRLIRVGFFVSGHLSLVTVSHDGLSITSQPPIDSRP